jgi:hypothetical protein
MSGGLDLILYDTRARQCLVVGSWESQRDTEAFRKKILEELGSASEHKHNNELNLDIIHVYSCKPEYLTELVKLEPRQIVDKIPGGSLLNASRTPQTKEGAKLRAVIKYHLARLKKGFFYGEDLLNCSEPVKRPDRVEISLCSSFVRDGFSSFIY